MKLDLDQPIPDVDGNPRKNITVKVNEYGIQITDQNGLPLLESKGDFKLGQALFASVNGNYDREQLAPDEIYWRGKTARKVHGGGEKNFSADEITRMMALVAKRYSIDPVLVLTICEMIDPDKFKPVEGD